MPSLASKTMPFMIGLRGVQKPYDSAVALQEQATALLLRPKSFNPPSIPIARLISRHAW